jgi:hypothetical protein
VRVAPFKLIRGNQVWREEEMMQYGDSVPAAPRAIALSEMNDHKIAKLLSHPAEI